MNINVYKVKKHPTSKLCLIYSVFVDNQNTEQALQSTVCIKNVATEICNFKLTYLQAIDHLDSHYNYWCFLMMQNSLGKCTTITNCIVWGKSISKAVKMANTKTWNMKWAFLNIVFSCFCQWIWLCCILDSYVMSINAWHLSFLCFTITFSTHFK